MLFQHREKGGHSIMKKKLYKRRKKNGFMIINAYSECGNVCTNKVTCGLV